MNKRFTLPFLAVLAALAVGLLFLMPGGLLQAQENAPIMYPENSEDVVATFTAVDPEGAMPIAWSLATGAQVAAEADLTDADNADVGHFTIDDEDGMLKFSSPPDFENPSGEDATSNTYKVVVAACDVALADDGTCSGQTGYHKVTVMVTNVDETGKVTLATNTANGTPQYLVGAILTATASDGDITNATQTFTADVATEVSGVTWRWYRGGTEITDADAQDNTYTLQPTDRNNRIRVVVRYQVDGNTRQESAETTTDYSVLIARVGDNQLKFDPAAVSRTISEGDKGRNVGAPVTATGNHGTVRYSLDTSGDATAAAPRFKIDPETGQITTDVDLDYEGEDPATADAAGSCSDADGTDPDRECTVTVIATDSTGDSTTGTDPNFRATVTIMLTDMNEKPAFSTGEQTVGVPENSTDLFGAADAGYSVDEAIDVTYTAMDPEGRTVNYSLTGPDASKFQLSGTPPVLSFASKPDFEAKASADRDNVYMVTVRASVGSDTGERMVRVTVGDDNEGPDVSGLSTRNFPENSEDVVATFTAVDPEGAMPIAWYVLADDATFAEIEGVDTADAADADHFTIDDEDGMLKFSSPPDFENPSGEDATSNTYKVVVAACDVALADDGTCSGQTGYHKVTVMVTNVDETGKVTLATNTANGTPQYLVGAILTATASDGDITNATQTFTADVATEVSGVTWRWYRGGTEITDADAQDNTYTLQPTDRNNRIRVVVRYQVDGNTRQESAETTTDYSVLIARVGDNQLKFDPAAVSRTISEGDKGRNVGAPVTATGNHGTVRYSLDTSGDATAAAPRFKIDPETGQITTDVDLDYEGEDPATADAAGSCSDADGTDPDRECTVTVIATDSTGDSTTGTDPNFRATVTIMLTDMNEKPAFSTGEQTVGVPENSTDLFGAADAGYSVDEAIDVTYTAMDPEGRTVNYSLTGPDASKFQLSGTPPVLSFASKPDFEAKASADRDNVYMVTVRASAGSDTGERMVRVTVGDDNEAPEIIEGGLSIAGSDRVSVPEDGMPTVGDYTAVGPGAASARWTLAGDDSGVFMVLPDSGMSTTLRFVNTPNFEAPTDANGDNVYMVTLNATDSEGNMATREITVTVTDEDEPTNPLLDRYAGLDGVLQLDEVYAAIDDYFDNDALTLEQVYELVDLYFES